MTTSVLWTAAQWGVLAGVWSNQPQMVLFPLAITRGGAIFDASTGQTLRFQGGSILDPPVLATFPIVCDATNGGVGPVLVEIGLVPDPQPLDFSTALAPWTRGEISLGSFSVDVLAVPPAQETQTFTFSAEARLQVLSRVIASNRWNGRVAFSFRIPAAGSGITLEQAGNNLTAQMQTTQERFFAGLAGGPAGKVRAVRDGRYAMPAWNTELIRDGEERGLWVRPWDQDPEDPEAKYRPRAGEGTIDDVIPDL